jgi:peptidoglycan/xylan/chitin deacetylase (PgdA/CDA1 family)/GT2 family glycosyltransferase
VQAVAANGVVALTFDDGPDPTWTPKVLEILRRHHVTATFFMIGTQAQQHQQLVRQVLRDGNVIANHTYSHQDLSKLPGWRANLEILGGSAVIEGITGQKPLLFRSPYGAGDMTGTRVGGDQMAENLGMRSENWNDDPEDWTRPGADVIVQRALDQATERTVILLHDGGGNRSETIAALPGIIEGLRARGYVFTTLDALDGSVVSPYGVRHGIAANARGVAVIAAFRLEMAGRHLIMWLLVGGAVLALLRLLVTVPLAVIHGLRRRRRQRLAGPARSCRVSVVVPAHNEGTVLDKTLQAVAQLDGAPYEVIVVDDGSTDDTAAVARRYPVTLLTQAQQGKAAALNHGVAAASGEVVVVLDADTVLDQSFVSRVLPHFADPHVAAVAGNVRVGNRNNFLARLQSLEYVASLNLDRRAQAALNVVSVVPGAAGAFRKTALAEIGGYPDDTLVEDADLTVALLAAGWHIPYEPDAVAWTEAPQSVRDVIRQRQRWSYGTVEVVAKHAPRMMDPASGRVGLLALPWLLVTQVLLPLTGPLTDAFLLYLLALGQWGPAAGILGIALACDVAVVGSTLLIDGRHRSDIAYVPLMRLIWRPLQLAALVSSLLRWSHGRAQGWRRVKRHNTVVLPPPAGTPA